MAHTNCRIVDLLFLIGYLHRRQPRMDELMERTGWSLAKAKRILVAARSIGGDIRAARSPRTGWHYVLHASTMIDSAEAAKYVRRHKL